MYRYEDNHLKVAYSSSPPIPVWMWRRQQPCESLQWQPVLLGDFTLYPESSPCGNWMLENNARGRPKRADFRRLEAPLFPPKY